jgi:DNA-binding Lrp family transcriptional regulator
VKHLDIAWPGEEDGHAWLGSTCCCSSLQSCGKAAWGVRCVVKAYIFIQTGVGRAAEVSRDIAAIEGVESAEDVTGPYDVIVQAEAKSIDDLGKLVATKIHAVEGITRTLTCPVVRL